MLRFCLPSLICLFIYFYFKFLKWYDQDITKELFKLLPMHSCLCHEPECLPVSRVRSRHQDKRNKGLCETALRRTQITTALEANKAEKASTKKKAGKKAGKPQSAKVKEPLVAKKSPHPDPQPLQRFRYSPARCQHGKQQLSVEELKGFGWLKSFINVLPLNDIGQEQQQKLDALLQELTIAAGGAAAAQKKHKVFVARNVAITPNNAVRADLQELVHRYRSFYNALVSLFNSDETATLKVLSELSRADGASEMLNRLRRVTAVECKDLEDKIQRLLYLQQRLEAALTGECNLFFSSSFSFCF
jgi:hypothetical protein